VRAIARRLAQQEGRLIPREGPDLAPIEFQTGYLKRLSAE
jgi:hypothetical protein